MQNEYIHRVLAQIKNVHQSDSESWTGYCPIHEGSGGTHTNSLSIAAPDDGRILIKCHNGCDSKEIVYALGFTWTDMFPPKSQAPTSRITAEYDYRDEDGVVRFQVCRIEPGKDGRAKDFRQRQPDGAGGWTWKTKGLQKFPYRLQELAAAPKSQPVWIVEGEKQVDYLRSLGLVATCNPGGAGKWLKSYAKYFEDRDCVVIPDCDPPNEKTGKIVGAAHAEEVANSLIGIAKSIHVIELPDCQPKWGLDDWLQKGGHTLEDLAEICQEAEEWGPTSKLTTQVQVGTTADGEPHDPLEYHRKILQDIGMVYCAETEASEIEIFSNVVQKFSTIRDPGKLTYPRLLQVAGSAASLKVRQNDGDAGAYSMAEIRNAIAIVAGSGKRGSEKLGAGIWKLKDSIVLVNGSHIAIYDGQKLTKDTSAVSGGNVFDLGSHESWFDFDAVSGWINRDDREWIGDSMQELCRILEQWHFKIADPQENPQICAEILASLIVASLIQSLWTFRPMVFLLGESNCGKSTLIQLLCGEETNPLDDGLIGTLAIHSSNQSAAGIRQMAERSSRPVFVDEFEKGRHRTEILELLRGASRGSQSIRGTAGQKAVTTKLAFMAWAASTESGLIKQVDQNRWIQIQMVPPETAKMGKLKLPSVDETIALRNKLVAAAVVIGNDAREMVDRLMVQRPRDIDHRICQIFSVPAAVFAVMSGMPDDVAAEVYRRMLNTYDHDQIEKDQDTTLETILTSHVRMPGGEKSLLSILRTVAAGNSVDAVHQEETLATHGVKIVEKFPAKFVFFAHRIISRSLLRGSNLEGVKIDDLLLRIPGATRSLNRISGKPIRGVMIPFEACLPAEEPDLFAQT